MFVQELHLKRAKWNVTIFHAVDHVWSERIRDRMIEAGCRGDDLTAVSKALWGNMKNTGITYSNLPRRTTVMVIGFTTSGEEYWNTLDHEKLHLLQDIAIEDGIDPFGEDISYISGEFIGEVYSKAKELLCDCCRKKKHGR